MSSFEERELKQLEGALSALVPRVEKFDRDRLLFEAGRRSVRPNLLWRCSTIGFSALALLLAVVLLTRQSVEPIVHHVEMPGKVHQSHELKGPAEIPDPGESASYLRQLAVAMQNYQEAHDSLPPPTIVDDQYPQLLSWRVHVLPFIDQENLYKAFKLDEPWDSAHNKRLIEQIPPIYQSPLSKNVTPGKTVYLAPAGKQMLFGGPMSMSLLKIPDGRANTILLVEANDEHAVYWTQPEDYVPERTAPTAGLLRKGRKGFQAAFADGSVRWIDSTIAPEAFWSALTATGGEARAPDEEN